MHNIKTQKTRNLIIDNLKGFLIFCVVLGHFCERYLDKHSNLEYLIFFIYLFHMPCFIYISGYFSKKYDFKKNSKLIYQFFVFGLIYVFIVNKIPEINIKFQIAIAPWTMWYLISLFSWKIMVRFINHKKPLLVLSISFILAIIIGCFEKIGNYFSLARTIGFFPFFLLGYYSNEDTIEKIKNMRKIKGLILLIITIIATYVLVSKEMIPLVFQWSSKPFKEIGFNNIEGIIYKVIIILLELGCCIGLINLIPKRKTIFCRLGENSITIYGFHAAIVYVITYFIKDVPPYKGLIYILILGLTIGLTFVLSSKPIQELYKILMKPYKKISEDGDAK